MSKIAPTPPRRDQPLTFVESTKGAAQFGLEPLKEAHSGSLSLLGESEFVDTVQEQLRRLWATDSGRSVLGAVLGSPFPIEIVEGGRGEARAMLADRSAGYLQGDGSAGPGTPVVVRFGLEASPSPEHLWDDVPREVVLFHELIHARDYSRGRAPPGLTEGTKNTELSAIGLPFRLGNEAVSPTALGPTENSLRAELNLPARLYP